MIHSRKGPSFGVEQRWKREEPAAQPDAQEKDSGASLRHTRLERPNDGDVSEVRKNLAQLFGRTIKEKVCLED